MKTAKTAKEIRQMPLVVQMLDIAKEQGIKVTIQEAYKTALASNLIDEAGNPTKWALDNDLVGEIPANTFNKLDYPYFVGNSYDDYVSEVSLTDEHIISKRDYFNLLLQSGMVLPNGKPTKLAMDEKMASFGDFMPSVELQNKMTVEEFIKACDPMQKYDAKHVTKLDDDKGFGFDISLTYDIAKRVVNGEFGGDIENSKAVMKQLEEQFGNDIEPL